MNKQKVIEKYFNPIKYDTFFGKITTLGNACGITIPKINMEYFGLKKGDKIKVYYKKVE